MFGLSSSRRTITRVGPRSHHSHRRGLGGLFHKSHNNRSHAENRAARYQAAMNNSNVGRAGRRHAKRELRMMGREPNHEELSTRFRSLFHLGGRRENRRYHTTTTTRTRRNV
ncbi:hypothetical protein BT69DRAFT_1284157 [Atractiella rhizophila]|nr:hypothetical protein BT69DRAFT_1284157 [Atractiella rhizophila]